MCIRDSSVCDSLNYITEREELLQVFRLVNNYLDTEGDRKSVV